MSSFSTGNDIWIVEYWNPPRGWEQYCDVEYSHPKYAARCAGNVLSLNGWVEHVRVSKVEWTGDRWKLLKVEVEMTEHDKPRP
jgi:hypothetical protein